MNCFEKLILILNFPYLNNAINVEVNGLIDFGTNWDEYTVRPLRSHFDTNAYKNLDDNYKLVKERNKKYGPYKADKGRVRKAVRTSKGFQFDSNSLKKEHNQKSATRYHFKNDNLYVKPHKVKHNHNIKEFTNHLYKQNLKVFEILKSKFNNENVRHLIDMLAGNYEDKFLEFVNETQNQNIKTRLGTQKVILNTIETSNHILKRLVNYLIGDMDKKGMIGNSLGAPNVFQNEVDKEMQLENKHICNKFAICRSNNGFSHFLIDSMTIILSGNNRKIKQMFDALTEILKNTDFNNVMDSKMKKKFHKAIEYYEQSDVYVLRAVLVILKNLITHRNKPITVIGETDVRINKTIAFLDMYDTLQNKLPENEANMLDWDDMRNSLSEWSESERNDIVDIMQTFVDHIKKPIDEFDAQTANNFKEHLNIILS